MEHGLCARTVNVPLAKAWGLSLRTGAQTMLYLSLIFSVSPLSRAAKPNGAWNKIFVMTRQFIALTGYYKLPINHFLL